MVSSASHSAEVPHLVAVQVLAPPPTDYEQDNAREQTCPWSGPMKNAHLHSFIKINTTYILYDVLFLSAPQMRR